jgi:hypothetical protein
LRVGTGDDRYIYVPVPTGTYMCCFKPSRTRKCFAIRSILQRATIRPISIESQAPDTIGGPESFWTRTRGFNRGGARFSPGVVLILAYWC